MNTYSNNKEHGLDHKLQKINTKHHLYYSPKKNEKCVRAVKQDRNWSDCPSLHIILSRYISLLHLSHA